jgi:hypothetical protein
MRPSRPGKRNPNREFVREKKEEFPEQFERTGKRDSFSQE